MRAWCKERAMRGFAHSIATAILVLGTLGGLAIGLMAWIASGLMGLAIGIAVILSSAFCSALLNLLVSIDERLERLDRSNLEKK